MIHRNLPCRKLGVVSGNTVYHGPPFRLNCVRQKTRISIIGWFSLSLEGNRLMGLAQKMHHEKPVFSVTSPLL